MILYRAIDIVFSIIVYAILARVIISWIPINKDNRIIQFLYTITEPILAPIRSLIERSSFGRNMMFDISPIIAFLLIEIIRNILLGFFR
jgi:YGGT family.